MELIRRRMLSTVLSIALLAAAPLAPAQNFITIASTTSTEQSGLFKHMLPAFQKKTGIEVQAAGGDPLVPTAALVVLDVDDDAGLRSGDQTEAQSQQKNGAPDHGVPPLVMP